MKLSPYTAFVTIILLFAEIANSQVVVKKTPTEDAEKLKKEAVVFLRETMADVGNLRTLENRISFAAEMASLIWFHDEKEARSIYTAAISDFKELLMQYDARMNSIGAETDADGFSGGIFGRVNDRSRLSRQLQTAMQVRKQIAMSLAEHDAEFAFNFYYESLNAISNIEFRKQAESDDAIFEQRLLTQIAESNASMAVQLARKTLDKGVNYYHVDLLRKIHSKDSAKGVEFAGMVLSRIKAEDVESPVYIFSPLLKLAGETLKASAEPNGNKPIYTMQELREISDLFARVILRSEADYGDTFLSHAAEIEKYSPSRAAQIRAKFKVKNPNSDSSAYDSNMDAAINTAGKSGSFNSNSNINPKQKEIEARLKDEESLKKGVESLSSTALPKEEREKIIDEVRKILMRTPGRDKKIMGLSLLATQVSGAGDKELAAEIMKDAHNLINPQPKNYQDFLLTWMLAAGYAEADPEKAFPLLEDTIIRANETISAFVKVGEFIDAAGEMIQDGEVQVGAFGGSMVRGLTSELGMADSTLRTLAKTDFAKTKNLTSRFEQPEARILAKMMILRAVLGEGKGKNRDNEVGGVLNDSDGQ